MKLGTVDEIVAEDRCCGCGVCATGCPTDAISMHLNADREYQPVVDPGTCIDCPICLRICPFDENNLARQAQEAVTLGPSYGVPEEAWIYRGYQIPRDLYMKSASGGLLSALQSFLLEEKLVDCVIHAQPNFARSEDLLFQASISRSAEEVNAKKSSFYYPIEFSQTLDRVATDETIERVCFTGIPCTITGVENLTRVMKKLRRKIWVKLAVVCGHSVSGQLAEALCQEFPHPEAKRKVNFRSKTEITEASNFNTEMTFEGGESIRQSRFVSPFTRNWRTYSYALNACFSCPDFWGAHADASFKDAWGFGEGDRREGESVVVVRSERVRDALQAMADRGLVKLQSVARDRALLSQWESVEFKAMDIRHRIGEVVPGGVRARADSGIVDRALHTIIYRLKRLNMRASKWLFRRYGRTVPAWISRALATAIWYVTGLKRVLTKWRESSRTAGPGLSVVYAAGFGYGNLGDEAQLHSNLALWRELAPSCHITVLSPRPPHTRRVHPGENVIPASRRALWSVLGLDYFGMADSRLFAIPFLLKYPLVLFNALLVRWLGITVLLTPHSAALLQRLKEADVLHIGGGGYLTGKTPSRLYDHMALIRIARLLDTDVILSGHNLGVWRNSLQRLFARNLERVQLIGLRDEVASVEALEEIGIAKSEAIRPLFDDALFCPGAPPEEMERSLRERGIETSKGFVVVNVHYWGVDPLRAQPTLDKLASDLARIRDRWGVEPLFVPMVRTDLRAIDVVRRAVGGDAQVLDPGDDFRLVISVIRSARLCVTMKHHPIVFAMGGGVPTIAIYSEEYYRQKNSGAMQLFGQEGFCLGADSVAAGGVWEVADQLLGREEEVREQILSRLEALRPRRGEIIRDYLRSRGLVGDGWENWNEVDVSALAVRGL